MKKWAVIILLLALLGYFSYPTIRRWKPLSEAETKDSGVPTTKVESREIQFSITAAGEISPADQVSVRPEVNGRIATLPVDIGDQVKQGQILFTLDDRDLQTERSSRLIEIERAKLELDRAKLDFERARRLYESNLMSLELFEDARIDHELAKNALARSQEDLNLVEDRLTKTQIIAPFDCTILTRPVSAGQAVSGSGGFNSGTEVLTIANLNEMVIYAHINQADITRIKVGQEVEIRVEAVSGLKVKGTVQRKAPQATIKNNIKGYAVRILLKDVDPLVQPGMTAQISIPVNSSGGGLAVPLVAVFTEDNRNYVYVKKGNVFERQHVQIGVIDYRYAEVTQGLTSSDIVALQNPD